MWTAATAATSTAAKTLTMGRSHGRVKPKPALGRMVGWGWLTHTWLLLVEPAGAERADVDVALEAGRGDGFAEVGERRHDRHLCGRDFDAGCLAEVADPEV